MTGQERQKHLDVVRDFLERNDGRPFVLGGAACIDRGHVDGMRLAGGIETAEEAKSAIVGMLLIAIGPSTGTAKQRQKILTACMMEAFGALEEEAEVGDEVE